jgi:hypothetical protein
MIYICACLVQMQQWATEREARDKIESDLRAQIAKYGLIMEANEKKYTHVELQLQQLTEQLEISEHQNNILMEENKKHVTDFEHFKAQLEFHKSVSISTDHISNRHITGENVVHHYVTEQTDAAVEHTGVESSNNVETTTSVLKPSAIWESDREMHLNEALQTEVHFLLRTLMYDLITLYSG